MKTYRIGLSAVAVAAQPCWWPAVDRRQRAVPVRGNPLGLQGSVTQGIVSALGRNVPEDNGVTLANAIQTSAEINPGNSGGALVNLQGQVIGIPTLAAVDPELGNGAAPGIGFAIPSNTVEQVANQLLSQR